MQEAAGEEVLRVILFMDCELEVMIDQTDKWLIDNSNKMKRVKRQEVTEETTTVSSEIWH